MYRCQLTDMYCDSPRMKNSVNRKESYDHVKSVVFRIQAFLLISAAHDSTRYFPRPIPCKKPISPYIHHAYFVHVHLTPSAFQIIEPAFYVKNGSYIFGRRWSHMITDEFCCMFCKDSFWRLRSPTISVSASVGEAFSKHCNPFLCIDKCFMIVRLHLFCKIGTSFL